MNTIHDDLLWRYAVKSFDPLKEITETDRDLLISSMNLTPTSNGLQHFRVIQVKDKLLRKQLRVASYNQSQVTDASDFFVFAVCTNINDEFVDEYITRVALIRQQTIESLHDYGASIKKSLSKKTHQEIFAWATKQAYIGLGFLLTTCAHMHIDACPMEGIQSKEYDKILKLPDFNLQTVVACAVGYRSDDDPFSHFKKVRLDKKDFILTL